MRRLAFNALLGSVFLCCGLFVPWLLMRLGERKTSQHLGSARKAILLLPREHIAPLPVNGTRAGRIGAVGKPDGQGFHVFPVAAGGDPPASKYARRSDARPPSYLNQSIAWIKEVEAKRRAAAAAPPVAQSDEPYWVLLIHLSGNQSRRESIEATWCRETSPDMRLHFFGNQGGGDALDATLRAFSDAVAAYPLARWISKHDDDCFVYTRNLAASLATYRSHKAPLYLGYPLRTDGILFASGGAGYILNMEAARLLQGCDARLSEYEDVGVARCLLERGGLQVTDLAGLHPHNHFQMLRWDKFGHPPDHVHDIEPLEGYLHPLSYHYVPPPEMRKMGDDIHYYGKPLRRSERMPRILHQFWVGDRKPPLFSVESCKWLHPAPHWQHILWDDDKVAAMPPYGGMVNSDHYQNAGAFILKSDIARYEFLLFFGGVYYDADSQCVQPLDTLLDDLYNRHNLDEGFCVYEDEDYIVYENGFPLVANGVLSLYPYSPLGTVIVRELQRTNWALPAWQATGPGYLTMLIFSFRSPSITFMPSHYFFPYHHTEERPASRDLVRQALVEANSFTDQLWGTTHDSYSLTRPTDPHHQPLEKIKHEGRPRDPLHAAHPVRLHSLLADYWKVHADGLALTSSSRPRWAIASPNPRADACARVRHLVSALLFAVLTDRTLLFDWEPGHTHDRFEDPLVMPPIAFSLADTARYLGETEQSLRHRASGIEARLGDHVRFSNLDSAFPESLVLLEDFGWQHAGELLANAHYKEVFSQTAEPQVFGNLSSYLFRPNPFSANKDFRALCWPGSLGTPDSGLLPQLPAFLRPPTYRGAFAYLLYRPSVLEVSNFRTNLALLHRHFNSEKHYPVVLFVERRSLWQYLQAETSSRLHFAEIDPAHLMLHPNGSRGLPDAGDPHAQLPGQRARYAAGFLFAHPALSQFDAILRIDGAAVPDSRWTGDPFASMLSNGKALAFDQVYVLEPQGNSTLHAPEGIWGAFAAHVETRGLSMAYPSLVWDQSRGIYLGTCMYSAAVGGLRQTFLSKRYLDLFLALDRAEGWMQQGWSDRHVLALFVALHLGPENVERLSQVSFRSALP